MPQAPALPGRAAGQAAAALLHDLAHAPPPSPPRSLANRYAASYSTQRTMLLKKVRHRGQGLRGRLLCCWRTRMFCPWCGQPGAGALLSTPSGALLSPPRPAGALCAALQFFIQYWRNPNYNAVRFFMTTCIGERE